MCEVKSYGNKHCMKSVRIRSYSGPHLPAFGLSNSEYRHFLLSENDLKISSKSPENTRPTLKEKKNQYFWASLLHDGGPYHIETSLLNCFAINGLVSIR